MTLHEKVQHPLYKTWKGMRYRCSPNTGSKCVGNTYERYAGRGIVVCDRWLGKDGFENFLNDMGSKPSPKHTLDRIDNDGNYEPANCRWATPFQQRMNTSKLTKHPGVTKYTYKGKTRWIAHMVFERETVLREWHETFEEAWAARKAAEAKYIKD